MWGLCRVDEGSICGVAVGSMWGRCGVDVGSKEADVFVDGKIYRENK